MERFGDNSQHIIEFKNKMKIIDKAIKIKTKLFSKGGGNTDDNALKIAREVIGDGPVILEAGAHKGTDTIKMNRLFTRPTIHAFEPHPELFRKIERKLSKFNNIHCYNTALSDKKGSTEFFISSGKSDGSSSILKPKKHLEIHKEVTFDEVVQVPAISIDQWMEENNISGIDFAWFDLQGAEPMVLRSSPVALGTMKAIFTEVSLVELYEGTPLYPEFRAWM